MYRVTILTAAVIFTFGAPAAQLSAALANRFPCDIEKRQSDDTDRDQQRSKSDVEVEASSNSLALGPETDKPTDQPKRGGVQTTTRNGITTTTVNDPSRDVRIVEDPQKGITVEIVRRYGPEDVDRLKQKHPELIDYVEMFPEKIDNHQIELNLSIRSTFQARTIAQLRTQHPDAFNIYRRYRKSR